MIRDFWAFSETKFDYKKFSGSKFIFIWVFSTKNSIKILRCQDFHFTIKRSMLNPPIFHFQEESKKLHRNRFVITNWEGQANCIRSRSLLPSWNNLHTLFYQWSNKVQLIFHTFDIIKILLHKNQLKITVNNYTDLCFV